MTAPLSAPDVAPSVGAPPRIRAEDISVFFGGISALKDVTIEVPAGEIRGLIGPNGAGKTTLFDVISGLRPPTKGVVMMDGRDVTSHSPMRRARSGLRRTFQRQQVFSWLSVEDNVLAAVEWRGGGGGLVGDAIGWPGGRRLERARRRQVEEVLQRCGLLDIRNQPIGILPIAKVRLVEIARALVDEPRILLLDEPTSGLHPSECDQVADVVRRYRDETGATFVVVEHDIEWILRLCDRITVLETGTVIFDGSPSEARNDPGVRRAYLG